LYTAGPLQGSDIINATVTGAQSKTGTASLAMQVGVNPNAGPQVAINLTPSLPAGQSWVAPNATLQIMATVTSNGQPVANQPVVFNFGLASSGGTTSGPTLNGATSTVTATTNATGQAFVTYVAGPQAGIDTIIATYSQNNTVLGMGSIYIGVQSSAPPTWSIHLASTATCTSTTNAAGTGLSCSGIQPNDIASNGVQYITNGAELRASVIDRQGYPVPNAVVLFSLGSVSTSTGLPYCTPPAVMVTQNNAATLGDPDKNHIGQCATGTTTTTGTTPTTTYTYAASTVGNVNAGFASGTSTVVPTITAVTDANGVATARYVAGGSAGTDIVLVNAGYNTGTAAAPVLGTAQGTQSASMIVQ
ncbi:hypothetical protein, partial [Thiomonas sp.]